MYTCHTATPYWTGHHTGPAAISVPLMLFGSKDDDEILSYTHFIDMSATMNQKYTSRTLLV
jgi:hypothetical protein